MAKEQDGTELVTRMLRIWCAARSVLENPLPQMRAHITPILPSPELVPACDSLFSLTEAVLGRPLLPARCRSASLSRDEAAVLAMLRHAPSSGSIRTSEVVPHGLPAALRWAAFAVVRALADKFEIEDLKGKAIVPKRCPFYGTDVGRAA